MIESNGKWIMEEDECVSGEMYKKEIEQELLLKDQRVKFWEKYHSIPTNYDLIWWGLEAET